MPEENIWLRERRRELDSLGAIIDKLEHTDEHTMLQAPGATERQPGPDAES